MVKASLTILAMLMLVMPAAAQIGFNPTGQQPYPGYTSPISPYSSIPGSSNPAASYYNITRPLLQQRNFNNQLIAPLNPGLTQQLAPDQEDLFPTLQSSGHVASFQYTAPYFQSNGAQRTYFPYNPSAANQQQNILRPQR